MHDRTIGALNLFCTTAQGLDDGDVETAGQMATMATLGIMTHWTVSRHETFTRQLQHALDSRVVIEQAKGVVAERSGVSMGTAFELIRSAARSSRRPLADVAEDVSADGCRSTPPGELRFAPACHGKVTRPLVDEVDPGRRACPPRRRRSYAHQVAIPVLATKLFRPTRRPDAVVRARLTTQLDTLLDQGHRVALVSAPPGFGKSTVLTEWVAALEQRDAGVDVAWLSLDEGDNDAARFVAHLVAALQGIGLQTTAPEGPVNPEWLTGLANAIAGSQVGARRWVLVLDDYHAISAPAVHEVTSFLVDNMPDLLRLVISTRADPPLPLPDCVPAAQLVELRAADLRFTAAEAAGVPQRADGAHSRPAPRWRRWSPGPRGGPQASSSRLSRCEGPTSRTSRRSSMTSPAATASSSTTSPRRCWPDCPRASATSCSAPPSWTDSTVPCATR